MKNKQTELERCFSNAISLLGEDVKRDGLLETPKRVAKMYQELLSGYDQNEESVFKLFEVGGYKDLVTVSNIDFYSLCEHHMIPFFGKVHIAYLPGKKVLGLSKFARLVEIFTRRLQTQENITRQLSESIQKYLKPEGMAVLVEANHLCVSMRGIRKKDFVTTTSIFTGKFKTDSHLMERFYKDINSYSLNNKK